MPFRSHLFIQISVLTVLPIILLFSSCQPQTENYDIGENFKVKDLIKDKHPMLLAVNIAFAKFSHKDEFPYLIKITGKYKTKGESLYPTKKEIYRLDSLEKATETALKEDGVQEYYVFRETHAGARNFYLITNDKDGAMSVLDQQKNKSVSSPFQYVIIKDPDWNTYNVRLKLL